MTSPNDNARKLRTSSGSGQWNFRAMADCSSRSADDLAASFEESELERTFSPTGSSAEFAGRSLEAPR